MRLPFLALLLGVVVAGLCGCSGEFDEVAAAPSATLFSIDGNKPVSGGGEAATGDDILHGYPILGATKLNEADQARVAEALNAAVQDSLASACFIPRHAIRIEEGGVQKDYVICFECLQYYVYADGKKTGYGLITKEPQPVLDAILKKAGIPLAPKSSPKPSAEESDDLQTEAAPAG
jgi:hypothetical protein